MSDQRPTNAERLAAVEARQADMHNAIKDLTETTKVGMEDLKQRLQKMELNGHGPDIKTIAHMLPVLEAIASALTQERLNIIIRDADIRSDRIGFWRTVRRVTHVDDAWTKIILGSILSSGALVEIIHMINVGHP